MRRRYFLLPSFCFRPLEALAEAGHCDSESVSVDWPTATEAGRVEKLAVATQRDCSLDRFDGERRERKQMAGFIFCSLTGNEPCGAIRIVEGFKFGFSCTSNLTFPPPTHYPPPHPQTHPPPYPPPPH